MYKSKLDVYRAPALELARSVNNLAARGGCLTHVLHSGGSLGADQSTDIKSSETKHIAM